MLREQQDVHEIKTKFCLLLGQTAANLFDFEMSSTMVSTSGETKGPTELYQDFSLEIKQASVSQCIDEHNTSVFEGVNKWNGQDAIMHRLVTKAPAVLHVHLKRFHNSTSKNFQKVMFEDDLIVQTSEGYVTYCLSSVLVHTGNFKSGHYFSFIKKQNSWFRCDDEVVSEVTQIDVFNANFGGRKKCEAIIQPTAYMLIFVLASAEETSDEPVIAEIMQHKYEACFALFNERYNEAMPQCPKLQAPQQKQNHSNPQEQRFLSSVQVQSLCENQRTSFEHSSANSNQLGLQPPAVLFNPSSFWTISKHIDVVHELNTMFDCEFAEHVNSRGTLIEIKPYADKRKSWGSAHHFVSATYVAKVYRILLAPTKPFSKKSQSLKELSVALHECAATEFVCDKKAWFRKVFGVVFHETDTAEPFLHIHICLIRTRLDSKDVTPIQASAAVVELLTSFGVMHGDGHVGNAKLRSDGVVELLDFERSFLTRSNHALIEMIKKYAEDPQSQKRVLQQMQHLGMDDTRFRFTKFVRDRIGHIFDITMDDILSVFKGKEFSSVTLSSWSEESSSQHKQAISQMESDIKKATNNSCDAMKAFADANACLVQGNWKRCITKEGTGAFAQFFE
jgi:hypothetical protein